MDRVSPVFSVSGSYYDDRRIEGWRIPPELLECIEKEDEGLEYWQCEINSSYRDSLPVFVVAASGNMDSAIEMTRKRHAA